MAKKKVPVKNDLEVVYDDIYAGVQSIVDRLDYSEEDRLTYLEDLYAEIGSFIEDLQSDIDSRE
jgi:DNA replication initiation complex subunit (GINS family)